MRPLRLQLWSYNYAPEPTGIGPVSTSWARAMQELGYEMSVVAAHPHYPKPEWGSRLRPYREIRDGVPLIRLPLWVGRETGKQRIRQEASFAASLSAAAPFLGRPDAIVAVSPSFPALAPAMITAAARKIPWILWLQDILPDGALTTGMLDNNSWAYRFSSALERRAYNSAAAIAVISESFAANLRAKNVSDGKVFQIYNPSTHPLRLRLRPTGLPTLLTMGNIGHSQGLEPLVRVFEQSSALRQQQIRMLITGHGTELGRVRAAVKTDRVELPGLVSRERLAHELSAATLGLVSQRCDIVEFNVPSKLMVFMGQGIPVLAAVAPGSEVARLVERSGAGWVVPSDDADGFGDVVVRALSDVAELERRGRAGYQFALANFTPTAVAQRFHEMLQHVMKRERVRRP